MQMQRSAFCPLYLYNVQCVCAVHVDVDVDLDVDVCTDTPLLWIAPQLADTSIQ